MKSGRGASRYGSPSWKRASIILLVLSAGLSVAQTEENTGNTCIWDTMSPFANTINFANRTRWRLVPTDLLTLKSNPDRAAGDPGYYGREYAFQGDAVIENEHYTVAFQSATGKVVVFSKGDAGKQLAAFAPLELKGSPATITKIKLLQNTGDEAALEITFSVGKAGGDLSAIVGLDTTEVVEIRPGENVKGMSILSPIQYGIVPSFGVDDLIFNAARYPSMNKLNIPCDDSFVGLLEGRDHMLVVTWPDGGQKTTLALGDEQREPRLIESLDINNDGKGIYLAVLSAPGIWHKEDLTASYLEKDVAVDWKSPFPARWVTQLNEGGVQTTYKFRQSRLERIWRPVIGAYIYPVWFDGDKTFYHMSKRVLPKGESVAYFLERQNTPLSVTAPVDIIKETLGRQTSDRILDIAGRVPRTHHRRGGAGVLRACTCGCTEAIQAVFQNGDEVRRAEYVDGAVDDMVFFVTQHVHRIEQYQQFAHDMVDLLNRTKRSNPELKSYLDSMEQIAEEIITEREHASENIKSLAYMEELSRQTKALTKKKDPKNLPAYLELGKKWRGMGGAQDDLVGQCHRLTRKLFEQAGYQCVGQPAAVELARQIRASARQCLKNPDGYEIWPDYGA
jgi:hypothetical protein